MWLLHIILSKGTKCVIHELYNILFLMIHGSVEMYNIHILFLMMLCSIEMYIFVCRGIYGCVCVYIYICLQWRMLICTVYVNK